MNILISITKLVGSETHFVTQNKLMLFFTVEQHSCHKELVISEVPQGPDKVHLTFMMNGMSIFTKKQYKFLYFEYVTLNYAFSSHVPLENRIEY